MALEDSEIWQLIQEERARQERLWGGAPHTTSTWLFILLEEVGECARALLGGQIESLRRELVQVAAVAVAILTTMD